MELYTTMRNGCYNCLVRLMDKALRTLKKPREPKGTLKNLKKLEGHLTLKEPSFVNVWVNDMYMERKSGF